MKVCIPTMGDKGLDEKVGEHFGRVPTYTVVNIDTNEVKIIENTNEHMGGIGYAPDIIKKAGVDLMLCSGLGQRAIGMFQELGIEVYVGAYGVVKDTIQQWKENRLQLATDELGCRKHTFRRGEE